MCKVEGRQGTETKGTTTRYGRLEKERNTEVLVRQIHEHLSTVADFAGKECWKLSLIARKWWESFREREFAKLLARLTI